MAIQEENGRNIAHSVLLMEVRKLSDEQKLLSPIPVAYSAKSLYWKCCCFPTVSTFFTTHKNVGYIENHPFAQAHLSLSSIHLKWVCCQCILLIFMFCFLQPWRFLFAHNLKKNWVIFLLLPVKSADKILMRITEGKIVSSPSTLPSMTPVSEELFLGIFVGVKLDDCYITKEHSSHQCFVSFLLG